MRTVKRLLATFVVFGAMAVLSLTILQIKEDGAVAGPEQALSTGGAVMLLVWLAAVILVAVLGNGCDDE